jgi:molybdate transport system substrate-binding protein
VRASGGRMKAIALPPPLEPRVAYAAAVVRGTKHAAAARRFVDGLKGADALAAAGFGRP